MKNVKKRTLDLNIFWNCRSYLIFWCVNKKILQKLFCVHTSYQKNISEDYRCIIYVIHRYWNIQPCVCSIMQKKLTNKPKWRFVARRELKITEKLVSEVDQWWCHQSKKCGWALSDITKWLTFSNTGSNQKSISKTRHRLWIERLHDTILIRRTSVQTTAQNRGRPAKNTIPPHTHSRRVGRHECTRTSARTLNDDKVWHLGRRQLVGRKSGKRRRRGRKKRRSLMIKLSLDLVFDRGSSHTATHTGQVTSPIMTLSGRRTVSTEWRLLCVSGVQQ